MSDQVREVLCSGTLGPELAAVRDALIIPLGKAAEGCGQMLVDADQVDQARCLFEFLHRSGANGHRVRQFEENCVRLRDELGQRASSYGRRPQ
jgi:hypothetical protein